MFQGSGNRAVEGSSVQLPPTSPARLAPPAGELLTFFGGHTRVAVANRFEWRDAAYRFIYPIYRRIGFTNPREDRRWRSIYDAMPGTATLLAWDAEDRLVGTLTLVFDSEIGIPADSMYPDELSAMRREGGRLCELISFGTADGARGTLKIIAALFYCAYLLAWRKRRATHFVVTVTRNHEKFYCGNLLFSRLGPVRQCQRALGVPAVLLELPFERPDRLRRSRRIFPLSLMSYTDKEEAEIAQRLHQMAKPMTQEEFRAFFVDHPDALQAASQSQRQVLARWYASVLEQMPA